MIRPTQLLTAIALITTALVTSAPSASAKKVSTPNYSILSCGTGSTRLDQQFRPNASQIVQWETHLSGKATFNVTFSSHHRFELFAYRMNPRTGKWVYLGLKRASVRRNNYNQWDARLRNTRDESQQYLFQAKPVGSAQNVSHRFGARIKAGRCATSGSTTSGSANRGNGGAGQTGNRGGSSRVGTCALTARAWRGTSKRISCRCTAADTRYGSVWGSGAYTDDSDICRAAVHAGVIPARGGVVNLRMGPGRNAYTGATRNGVVSYAYKRWHGTFTFAGQR